MRLCIALCVLVLLPGSAALGGYVMDFRSPGEFLGLDKSLGDLGLQEAGFSISAWIRYHEASNTAVSEVSVVTSKDSNFFNGFAGVGQTWAFSSTSSFSSYQPAAASLEWHHYAMVLNASALREYHYLDGVLVGSRSIASYAFVSDWASWTPLLSLGLWCYWEPPEGSAPPSCIEERMFHGQIDDLALHQGALSAAQIEERWNASLTDRIWRGLEPNLALFYSFDEPNSVDGLEVVNHGTAGGAYNLLIGRRNRGLAGDMYVNQVGAASQLAAPSFVGGAPSRRQPAQLTKAPLVVYARPGASVELASFGLDGQSYSAPDPFNMTAILSVPHSAAGNATTTVHVVPIKAPKPLREAYRVYQTTEDQPVHIRLWPGSEHTWSGGLQPILISPPHHGTLYAQPRLEDTLVTSPLRAGEIVDVDSLIVLYVPFSNRYGSPLDVFSVKVRLKGVEPAVETSVYNFTVHVLPVDDLPSAHSSFHAFDEDSQPDGREIVLNLTDAEVGQALAGYISRLPTKGTLYVVNASGARTRLDHDYNPFDVGAGVRYQYLSYATVTRTLS